MLITDTNKNGLGKIEVKTLSLPEYVIPITATYTTSGTVLLVYLKEGDPTDTDYQNIAVLNDDGREFRNIYSGIIRKHKTANGIRYMVFQDNKRVLLGDYVLECSPGIDNAEKIELVPVEYPAGLIDEPEIMNHWSEIIIAPDNEHIAWTMLRFTGSTGAVFLGKLSRQENRYIITDTKIISSLESMKEDPSQAGFFIRQTIRGGEVKQFVRGGTAISLVGCGKGTVISDSVIQELTSDNVIRITNAPGYDETTIFSPDEKLGLVMSSRFSPKTDPAIFGLLPRPGVAIQGLIATLYMYAIAGVRAFRKGNIGPALIEIEKSISDRNYRGISLNDPDEEWVYCSPMSWHPSSKKTMWPEIQRGTKNMRIRYAELLDYTPGPPVQIQKTPDQISYSEKDLSKVRSSRKPMNGKIAGLHSGYIELAVTTQDSMAGSTNAVYVNYSDDGKNFYNGFEKSCYSFSTENTYEADLVLTGPEPGEIKFRAAFSPSSFSKPPKLLFETAADGKPKSYGHASYGGITHRIEDLVE